MQLSGHLKRIDNAERELALLKQKGSTRDEVEDLRAEMKKADDSTNIDLLALKSHLWAVEQDLAALTKRDQTTIKV